MEIEIRKITCSSCNVLFWIGEDHHIHLTESHKSFYCPNGHSIHFTAETEAEKLRKQLGRVIDEKSNCYMKTLELKREIKKLKKKTKSKKAKGRI